MEKTTWPAEWVRSVLPSAVLALVRDEELYGYAIAQRLVASGLGVVKGSTLYPLLARLEQDGDLTSTWRDGAGGPGRKYYAITDSGEKRLDDFRRAWVDFSVVTSAITREKKVQA